MAAAGIDLSTTPSVQPPPGVTPNFVDPPTQAGMLIAVSVVLLILTTVFVAIRFYTRLVLVHNFGITDYLLLVGFGLAVVNSALGISQTNYGLGRRGWDVPLSYVWPFGAKYTWWQIKVYILSLGFTKIAILSIYPQISPSRTFRICVWALVALVACFTLGGFLWSVFSCVPISDSWDFDAIAAGACSGGGSETSGPIFSGSTNIATDFAILVLPMIMLRHVTLPRKKKFGVAIVLGTGSFASLISVIRMVVSIQTLTSSDPGYSDLRLCLWSQAELYAAVICACLPVLRPFVRRFLPILPGFSTEGSSNRRSQHTAMELDQNGNLARRQVNTSNGKSWGSERITKVKESQVSRDNTSEEYILSDRSLVDVTGSRGQSAGGKEALEV